MPLTSYCSPCRNGTYSSGGSRKCLECSENQFSTRGSSACQPCNPETEFSPKGYARCLRRHVCTARDYYEVHNIATNYLFKLIPPNFPGSFAVRCAKPNADDIQVAGSEDLRFGTATAPAGAEAPLFAVQPRYESGGWRRRLRVLSLGPHLRGRRRLQKVPAEHYAKLRLHDGALGRDAPHDELRLQTARW